jgi:hypothetical protein
MYLIISSLDVFFSLISLTEVFSVFLKDIFFCSVLSISLQLLVYVHCTVEVSI